MNIKTVISLIKRPSIQKRLSAIITQITRNDYPTIVNEDGGSRTDGKRVIIGIPMSITEEMIKRKFITKEEHVISILKGLATHEAEHIRSSSFPLFKKFQETVDKDYLVHNITGAGPIIGRGLMNSIEDGRIERRAINRLAGVGKHIRFMNLLFYKIVGKVNGELLTDFLQSVCVLATSNLYLTGWKDTYGKHEIYQLLEDCIPHIREGVAAETPEACYDACLKVHQLSLPILAKYVNKVLSEQEKAQQFAQDGDIDNNPRMDRADRKDAPGNSKKQYSNQKGPKGEKSEKPEDSKDSQQSKGEQESDESKDSQNSQGDGDSKEDKESKGGKGSKEDKDSKDDQQDGQDESASGGSDKDGKDDKQKDSDKDGDKSGSKEDNDSSEKKSKQSRPTESSKERPQQVRGNAELNEPVELSGEELEELIKELNEIVNAENEKLLADAKKEDLKEQKEDEAKLKKREKNHLTPTELKDISTKHKGNYIVKTSKDPLDEKSKVVANDLERFLLRIFKNMNSEERRFKRSGKIDKRSLVRLTTTKEPDIFYQDARDLVRPAAFCLDIDHSGSMAGEKMKLALRAASICQAAIQKHFPLRVMGFSSSGGSTDLYDYKDFDDKNNGSLLKFANFSGNGNCDGYAIEVAAKELEKRPEEIKVLIVLSDGYPSVQYKTDPLLDAKQAVVNARKAGIVVIAIVFGVDSCDRKNFETIYEKNIIMCEPNEIEKNLAKEIERIVRVM